MEGEDPSGDCTINKGPELKTMFDVEHHHIDSCASSNNDIHTNEEKSKRVAKYAAATTLVAYQK